jgi:PAS domain S-box-containing protein
VTIADPRPTTLEEALARLDETQDALRAIGAGEVDAFVVSDGGRQPNVFGLSTVDRPYRIFFENMPDGAATVSATGTVLHANDRLAEILDIPKSMIVGAQLASFVAGDKPEGWHQVDDRAGTGTTVEVDVVRPSGPPVPVLVSTSPLEVDGERFTCVTFTEMSAQRAHEAEIRFQALLLDTAGQAIVAVDTDGIALYWNKHAEQLYGWTADEALGRSVLDLLLPSPEIANRDQMSAMVRGGHTWGSDTWVKRRDGTLFPVFATSTPVTDDEGGLVAMITVATDITERKAAEERTQRLSAIVESSSDGATC